MLVIACGSKSDLPEMCSNYFDESSILLQKLSFKLTYPLALKENSSLTGNVFFTAKESPIISFAGSFGCYGLSMDAVAKDFPSFRSGTLLMSLGFIFDAIRLPFSSF
jgi:hypothetical protein